MARRLKRAAEIIPEINYRPGVIDPDVESAMISLFSPAGKDIEQPTGMRSPFPAPVSVLESTEHKSPIETPTVSLSETPTEGVTDTGPVGDPDTATVGFSELTTGDIIITPPVTSSESPPVPISNLPSGADMIPPIIPVFESGPVGVSELVPVGDSPERRVFEIPPGVLNEAPSVGIIETPPLSEFLPPDVLDIRHVKLRPVRNIQDGLTPGEFLLLTEMFKAAAPLTSSRDRMLLGAGYRTLSERTGQDPKTVKRNRKGLTRKFCIEVAGQNTFTEAAQFRVLHFDTILARWRSAGLFWVRRAGRSVDLTSGAPTGGVLETGPVGVSAKPSVFIPLSRTVPVPEAPAGVTPPQTEGKTPTGSVGVSPAYLSSSNTDKKSSTGAPPIIAAVIMREFGFVDDDALQTLIRKCRHNAPDATDEEIAELGTMTARRISKMRGIDNPVGLLIAQTANCFTGEPFAMYRQEKAGQQRRLAELYDGEN